MELTKIVWDSEDKLDSTSLEDMITGYLKSGTHHLLKKYQSYYAGDNYELMRRVGDRQWRGKTPNNYVPTAYYSTVVDTMAGYMYSNVQYQGVEDSDDKYSEAFNEVLRDNNVEVKDMMTGINSLCFNRGVELVYTTGDVESTDIKFSSFSPLEWILIYDNKVESDLFCGIRVIESPSEDYDHIIDVIYADEWQYFTMKTGKIKPRMVDGQDVKPLMFTECPVVVYNSSIVNNQSPFHVILPYIDALDFILTGNANEVERLVDAILVLGKSVDDAELAHMDEWKVLQDMQADQRAEYITKDASPEFRKYVSELLINEIHKHSHVIDWYNANSASGEASAKALRTRLFDMDMESNKVEKKFRAGADKRKRLLDFLIQLKSLSEIGNLTITYNRTTPDDKEDKMNALKNVDWLSKQTKVEFMGLDWDIEKARLDEEAEVAMTRFEALERPEIEEKDVDGEEEEV